MRKRNFLKAVCLFTCLSILMLSVPGAIASERTDKRIYARNIFVKTMAMFSSFLPFLNLNTKGDTSSDTVSNDDSSKKIQITGTLSSVRRPNSGDGEDNDK